MKARLTGMGSRLRVCPLVPSADHGWEPASGHLALDYIGHGRRVTIVWYMVGWRKKLFT